MFRGAPAENHCSVVTSSPALSIMLLKRPSKQTRNHTLLIWQAGIRGLKWQITVQWHQLPNTYRQIKVKGNPPKAVNGWNPWLWSAKNPCQKLLLSHTIFWLTGPSRITRFTLLSLGMSRQNMQPRNEKQKQTQNPYYLQVFYKDTLRFP